MFVTWHRSSLKAASCPLRCRRAGQLDPNAIRIFVKLDAVQEDALLHWLRKVIALVMVIVFAVKRKSSGPRAARGTARSAGTGTGFTAKLLAVGVARQDIFLFTTETMTEVAPDALLTLLYSKYAGRRNYLITERAEGERRRWFQELLTLDDNVKTVWMNEDFQPQ